MKPQKEKPHESDLKKVSCSNSRTAQPHSKGGIKVSPQKIKVPRLLIVIESKDTGEQFLFNPYTQKLDTTRYYKITRNMPLVESEYGHLLLLKGDH